MRRLMVLAMVVLVLGLSGCAPRRSLTGQPELAALDFIAVGRGHLQAAELSEASGLVAARRHPGVLWALNDSGNRPVLYALSSSGAELGQVALAGVNNVDWEDLATFSWQGEPYLLVADVGDNRARRSQVVLHALPEPAADEQGRFSGTVTPAWSLSFSYPDGPRDCEAVAVDQAAGQILLLSKRSQPPVLYRLPLGPPADDRPQVASAIAPVATIPPPSAVDLLLPYGRFRSQPTAMDLARDGRTLLILTYRYAYLYRRQPAQDWAVPLAAPPQAVTLADLTELPQREAACFSADGGSLFVTSEGAGALLLRLERR